MPDETVSKATCARCGLPFGRESNQCAAFTGDTEVADIDVLACRNRELGHVRALLRGSTRTLESVRDQIDYILEMFS